MPSPETLLLRLNLGSPSLSGGAHGHGGLRREHIAAALGMGSPPKALVWWAEARYLADPANLSGLAKEAWVEFARLGKREQWDRWHYERGRQLFRACAVVALMEVLYEDLRICGACKGRGETRQLRTGKPVVVACPRCQGNRPVELTDATRLAYLNAGLETIGYGISSSSWYDVWRHRYYAAVVMIRAWDDALRRHVRRYVGEAA